MISWITILLFFVYTWGLGFGLMRLVYGEKGDWLERNVMRIGLGIAMMIVIGVVINLLNIQNIFFIPIDWKIFLALALISPVSYFIYRLKFGKTEHPALPDLKPWYLNKKYYFVFFAIVLVVIHFGVFLKGSFVYPYLEDDDSWTHAIAVKYIAVEKKLEEPAGMNVFHYLDPYPPGYDIIMGILHQTSPSISWTLKFFNSLLISLSLLFFYFFARLFLGGGGKALFATFILVMVPSYLSHFIWSHAIIPLLFIISFYCLEMSKKDESWASPAAISIATIFLTQPEQAIKFMIMFGIYYLVNMIYSKKALVLRVWNMHLKSFLLGVLISGLWWISMLIKYKGLRGLMLATGIGHGFEAGTAQYVSLGFFGKIVNLISRAFLPYGGTATRAYSFDDFFVAKSSNMINSPVGWGIFITVLVVIAVIVVISRYKFKEPNMVVVLGWLLFTFLGVNSITFNLPIGLFAFRFWMLLAIPVSLIAYEAVNVNNVKLRNLLIVIVVIGVLFTSGIQKYNVNTSVWGPGMVWSNMDMIKGYINIKNSLPVNTKIFPICWTDYKKVIGMDMMAYPWIDGLNETQSYPLYELPDEFNKMMKEKKYEYVVMSGACVLDSTFGLNKTIEKSNMLIESGFFKPVFYNDGLILMKVV